MDYRETREKLLQDELTGLRAQLANMRTLKDTPDIIVERHQLQSRISYTEIQLLQLNADRQVDEILDRLREATEATKAQLRRF